MKERRPLPERSEESNEKLGEFQTQIDILIEEADESFTFEDLGQTISFAVCDEDHQHRNSCATTVYCGDICAFQHPVEAKGIVVWTNEACDLTVSEEGTNLMEYGGEALKDEVAGLPIVAEEIDRTSHRPARCAIGNAVILGPSLEYKKLSVPVVILTVGPFSPSRQSEALLESDQDYLHYSEIMLRSCYRSSLVLAKHAELKSLAITLLTTRQKGHMYNWALRQGLKTLLEEIKFTQLSDMHIIAKTPKEASIIVALMEEMGYVSQQQNDSRLKEQ
jgi:O-acetyl-ADP-ribose deacetylase (regulator of RNase III)